MNDQDRAELYRQVDEGMERFVLQALQSLEIMATLPTIPEWLARQKARDLALYATKLTKAIEQVEAAVKRVKANAESSRAA